MVGLGTLEALGRGSEAWLCTWKRKHPMLSELSGLVGRAFQAELEACEAMCFAVDEREKVISVLVVDSSFASVSKVVYQEHEGYRFEVLSVTDMRVLFRLDHVDTVTGFLRRCVVLKDEYQDLFDVKRSFRSIVLSEPRSTERRQSEGRTEELAGQRGGWFSSFAEPDLCDEQNSTGYRILCTGLPQIHRFIQRQCFGLLEELKDVTRSMEFALYRSSRQPQSAFSIEIFAIDHLNKTELEKRLALFCAQRNRYPGQINFRLFRSRFSSEARADFHAAVSRRILTEFYPRTSGSPGFSQAIMPHILALLLTTLNPEDPGAARTTLDNLVHDQLHRILCYKELPGEITDQERIAYQLDLHTDTMVVTQKAGIMVQLNRDLKFRKNEALYRDEIFQAFERWQDTTRPSASEASGLLFDSFCVSPYRSYYFLRLVQVLLNDKA